MPRRFNWKQKDANNLVKEYLDGKIPSARNLYNRMRQAGLHISKNTVYSQVRAELRQKRQRPRISLLAVPKPTPIRRDQKNNYRLPWHSQSILRVLDNYIVYKREKSLREVGDDLGSMFNVPPIKKEALKNHVMDRKRALLKLNGGKLKKFDKLNFQATDADFYDRKGGEVCAEIDKWYVHKVVDGNWNRKYDEEIEQSWLQTVRSELVKSQQGQAKSNEESSIDQVTFKRFKDKHHDAQAIEPSDSIVENNSFNVRQIHHPNQLYSSFIVEEHPSKFYHYIKRHSITAECSECREQWQLDKGSIARVVIENGRVLQKMDFHHEKCHGENEEKIKQMELERNVGWNGQLDEMDVYRKAEEMALHELKKLDKEEQELDLDKEYHEWTLKNGKTH